MAAKQDKVTIKIPRNLYNHLKEVIEGSGFDSVTDFVVYVLRDLASSERLSHLSRGKPTSDRLTKSEVEAIRARLKALGYL